MAKLVSNLFEEIPASQNNEEIFEEILNRDGIRIERICSSGQVSPEGSWYDQEENEWVTLLQGIARIEFSDGSVNEMKKGDYVFLPAHKKHRVTFTSTDTDCVWLAVFWKQQSLGRRQQSLASSK